MRKQCVPGSFFSAHVLEPGNEAKWHPAHITSSVEWGSHRPHKNPHRCGSRCIVLTCCIVCLSLIAVVVLIFVSRISKWQIIDTPMSYNACPINASVFIHCIRRD